MADKKGEFSNTDKPVELELYRSNDNGRYLLFNNPFMRATILASMV